MSEKGQKVGKMFIVGFGPGSEDHITSRAKKVIEESNVIVGYTTYIELVRDLIRGKKIIYTGMTEEVDRAKKAIDIAKKGNTVVVISSGDAGIYGMAGLIFQVLKEDGWRPSYGLEVEVVPGVTALSAVGSLLGAPLMHDFASISLSDLLTPWEVILKRVEAAAQADFVIALYNPKSGRRTWQIVETQKMIRKYREGSTPVGIVKSAYRDGQNIIITDLDHMLDFPIGMLTTIIIGNSSTFTYEELMITPRGYHNKYELSMKKMALEVPLAVPE
ncbi:MAG: precorrin-3B C(17)-methyltransferase [Candidatus Dadabacteria bacterium]